MKTPNTLYSRLALATSVTLVVWYFVVYAVYENINSEEVASNAIITSTLMGKIKNNLDTLNTQVTDLTATVVASSIWSKVGSDINYTVGKVGVWATTGNAELDIQSGIKPHWGIYHDETTEELRFWNGDNRVVIGSTGNVGIGTVSPTAKLTIFGDTWLDSIWTTDRTLYFRNQNTVASVASDKDLRFLIGVSNSPTEAMRITQTTGNVGIGTTTPDQFAGTNLIVNGTQSILWLQIGGVNAVRLASSASNSYIWEERNNPLILGTNGIERMRIDSAGNVGIGLSGFTSTLALYRNGSTPTLQLYSDRWTTSSSPAQLTQNSILFGGVNNQGWSTPVGAGIDFSINYPTDGNTSKLNFWTYPNTSASPAMTVYNSYLWIGTTTPWQKLDIVAGYGRVQTWYSWLTNSDIRYKKDVKTIDNSLDKILNLRWVYYKVKNWNENENIWVIAQELEKEFPELVVTEANGYKSVKYSEIVAPLINAIKELKSQKDSEIEELRREIQELKNR